MALSNRRTRRINVRQIVTVTALSIFVCWLGILVVSIFRKEQVARMTVAQTKAELAALDERSATLSATVTNMHTPRGQEASLRETFGVAKPGEEVIVVVPQKEMAPPPEPTFWQRIKEFFKGN